MKLRGPGGGLNATESFKASVDMPPRFSIRAKVSFGDPFCTAKTASNDIGQDLSDKLDQIRPAQPKWSMTSRGSGIPKPPDQPGPGQYPQPSTLYGSHPQLPVPGRVPKTTTNRAAPSDQFPKTPAPHDYEVVQKDKFGRYDQLTAPKFTMRGKVSFGDPFCSAKTASNDIGQDLADKLDQIRPAQPKWTMTSRGSGIPKPKDQPGPGQYLQPSTLYGSHPQLPVPGRVPKTTSNRWGKPLSPRPY